jgi:L-ascorbate metabolism protein UlaG (beta-lactamase superfamily)
LTVRWLGHSTLIIEIEGKRILTDPIWSERASPVQFAGPKRFTPPLIPLDELPPIDAVVISHDHYDHLDTATIEALKDHVEFFVPLGIGAHLESWGVDPERIHEMDWWEEAKIGGLRVVCTPARHFSGRSLRDRNHTLWASWSIIGEKRRAFFSGDTGLFPELSEIGERLGPFDITMIETGAYNQRWANMHMGPEQAVIAHRALRGKILLPIHWGLFNLALHSWVEPAERLRVVARRDGDLIAQPRPGVLLTMQLPVPQEKWWPDVEWQTAEEAPVQASHIDPDWLARFSKPAAIEHTAQNH